MATSSRHNKKLAVLMIYAHILAHNSEERTILLLQTFQNAQAKRWTDKMTTVRSLKTLKKFDPKVMEI